MTKKSKREFDWSYYKEPPSPQKSLFDKDELAERLAEILIEQIEEKTKIKNKTKNNEY